MIVITPPAGGGAPSGAAGGALGGTYPNPAFAVDMATQAELNAVAAALPADRLPGLITPFDPFATFTPQGATANLFGVRVTVPKAGTLHDFTAAIGSSAGNIRCAVYDTGDALTGSRSLLWDSGSVAVGTGTSYQVVGDPTLTVTAGQQLDFAVQFSGAATVAASISSAGNATPMILPTSFLPCTGGASPKRSWIVGQAYGAFPATIAEASLAENKAFSLLLIARVA